MNGYGSHRSPTATAFSAIQMMTMSVWPRMYCGVPKKRAAASARRPNASSPKALNWGIGASSGGRSRLLPVSTVLPRFVVLAPLRGARPDLDPVPRLDRGLLRSFCGLCDLGGRRRERRCPRARRADRSHGQPRCDAAHRGRRVGRDADRTCGGAAGRGPGSAATYARGPRRAGPSSRRGPKAA